MWAHSKLMTDDEMLTAPCYDPDQLTVSSHHNEGDSCSRLHRGLLTTMETSAHACLIVMGAHSELTRIITGGYEYIITLYFLKNSGASYASTGYNSHHRQSSRLWMWAHSKLITDDEMLKCSQLPAMILISSLWAPLTMKETVAHGFIGACLPRWRRQLMPASQWWELTVSWPVSSQGTVSILLRCIDQSKTYVHDIIFIGKVADTRETNTHHWSYDQWSKAITHDMMRLTRKICHWHKTPICSEITRPS